MHLPRKIHRKFLVFFLAPSDSFPYGKIRKSEMEDTVFSFGGSFSEGMAHMAAVYAFFCRIRCFFRVPLEQAKNV